MSYVSGKSKNFESYSHGVADTLKLAYDYDSVMHYSNKAFSYNLADTIQVRSMHKLLGTLRNEDGNANNDGSEKSHFWFTLYFFAQVVRVIFFQRVCRR